MGELPSRLHLFHWLLMLNVFLLLFIELEMLIIYDYGILHKIHQFI
jgi:hypothetical protein